MKKTFTLLLFTLLSVIGFGQFRYFYGLLSGSNEVPSNASVGNGVVIVKFNTISKSLELVGNYNALAATATASHIHTAAVGVNGPVYFGLNNTGGTSGNLTGTTTLAAGPETDLLAGNMYVNVHNSSFPGGEIRAQLTVVADGDGLMLNARLQGAQEVPVNASVGNGEANVLLEKSTNKVFLTGKYANLTTNISNSHIHVGRVAISGGVILGLTFSGGTTGTIHGSGTFTDALEDSLINAKTYVNVHSTTFPGGELRGQLTTFSQQQFFGGRLSGANEVPANASTGRGTVIVRYNTETNALELTGNYEGLSANITASHIHTGAPGNSGPVMVGLTNTSGTFGALTVSTTLTDPQEVNLLAGNLYVNVHTSNFPAGELRAQLVPGTSGETQYAQVLLTGTQEVPANASSANGLAAVMVDKITGQTYVTGVFTGLTANITAAHLHQAAVGVAGGVIMGLTFDGTTQGVVSGSQVLTQPQVEAFVNGLTYINIHNASFPGGEIRAQLSNLVLPVKLAYFNGYRQKNNAMLLWEAATEANVKQYEIEQQNLVTGTWMQKAIVPAKESAPYTYKAEDLPVFYTQSFANYRLRMVDKDGRAAYSQVVKVNFANDKSGLILMQNPVRNSLYFVVNGLNINQKAEAAIIDLNGRKLNRSFISGNGNQQINTSTLSAGIYLLQVQVGNETFTGKFLKQ